MAIKLANRLEECGGADLARRVRQRDQFGISARRLQRAVQARNHGLITADATKALQRHRIGHDRRLAERHQHRQHGFQIVERAGERADRIEAARQRDQPVIGNRARGGLDPIDPAIGRRNTD